MSAEQFAKLLRHGKPLEVVTALADLDEAARKQLLPAVKELRKEINQLNDFRHEEETWEQFAKRRKKWSKKHRNAEENLNLGLIGCGGANDAYRSWIQYNFNRERVVSVLKDRRPSWANTFVAKKIAGEVSELRWPEVRQLELAGVIDKPDSDDYARVFATAFIGFRHGGAAGYVPTSKRLLDDPSTLEDEIWRLFEAETFAFQRDHWDEQEKKPADYESWFRTFEVLVDGGHLDRDRVLDACVGAIGREFKQNHLSGFIKLLRTLDPTPEEIKARESAFLGLLVSPVAPVVSLATKTLAELHKQQALDAATFLAAAGPVFGHKAKGNAVQVLKIAKAVAADDPALVPAARELALVALSHPSADVQGQALDLIETSIGDTDESFRADFEKRAVHLAATHAAQAQSIIGTGSADELPDTAAPAADLDDVVASIRSLPDGLRSFLKVDADDPGGAMPPPLGHTILELPALIDPQPLVPLESVEGLLELTAQMIEEVDSADQVELLFDGISRLGHERGGNFTRLADPLVKRLESGGGGSSYGLVNNGSMFGTAVFEMVLTWLAGKCYKSRFGSGSNGHPAFEFHALRVRELTAVVLAGKPFTPFATPTHAGGWIEPREFVSRARRISEAQQHICVGDLMQGLLRLSPAGRDEALKEAESLSGMVGRLTRYALGGGEAPTKKDKREAHFWVCAARARNPTGDLSEALGEIAGGIPPAPDLLLPAVYRWQEDVETTENYTHYYVRVATSTGDDDRGVLSRLPKLKKTDWAYWPATALHRVSEFRWYSSYDLETPWRIEWLGWTTPLNVEPYFSLSIQGLDQRLDENTSRFDPVHAFLNATFDDNRCWGEMARLALCLGMNSKSADTSAYAVDSLIAGIESGRADASAFIATLSRLSAGGSLKPNRYADFFSRVAHTSALHRWWVATVTTGYVAAFDKPPAGGHFLYGLLLECLSSLGASLPDATRQRLSEIKGSSKAAKMARQLAALEGVPLEEPTPAIISEALAGRIALAEMAAL